MNDRCMHTQSLSLQNPVNNFTLNNLVPGSKYDVLVCLPMFRLSDLPPPQSISDNNLFVRICGYCVSGFSTDEHFFEFERTEVTQVNETYVNLTCQVESNAQFFIVWSTDDQTRLEDGGLFDDEFISIHTTETMEIDNELIMTSVLIAPDSILEQDNLQCTAESGLGSQSSMMGAFSLDQGNGL